MKDDKKNDRQGVALTEDGVIGVVELEVVIDEDGFPVWCAAVPNACQEHIKDAVEREIFGAEKWVVRSYIRHPGYLAPQSAAEPVEPVEPVELGEFRVRPCHDAAFGCQYDVVATSSQHAMLATMDGAKLHIVGDSIHATMQDAWQEGYRAGIEKGRKDQAVHEKHYLAGFNAGRASSSRGVALSEQLQTAYDKVSVYPEDRMAPDAVLALGEGFMDLLALRNLVPAAIAALSRASSSRAEVETYRHKFTGEVREFDAMDDASDSWVPVAVDKSELKRLHDIANEYDACVRHMDAGGDFHEFQAKLLAAAEAPNGEKRDA